MGSEYPSWQVSLNMASNLFQLTKEYNIFATVFLLSQAGSNNHSSEMVPGQECLLTRHLYWLARNRATSLQPSHLPCWTPQTTPDNLCLNVEMGRKAPCHLFCHLLLISCSLQRYSDLIHADIPNRQDEDHNSHFCFQLDVSFNIVFMVELWLMASAVAFAIHSQLVQQHCLVHADISFTSDLCAFYVKHMRLCY